MAVVDLRQPFNMLSPAGFEGFRNYADASRLEFIDGRFTSLYYGNYEYDGFGEVYGAVRAIDLYENSTLMFSVDDISIDANDLAYYVETGQEDIARSLVLVGNDEVYGSDGRDVLVSEAGDDRLYGGSGGDNFFAGSGVNYLDGGSGLDFANYEGNGNEYVVTFNGDGTVRVTDGFYNDDRTFDIERLSFNDGTLALDVDKGENAGEAYRIYQAAFDRTPDADGLSFWIQALDGGASLLEVAHGFVDSAEFQSVYGSNPTDEDYVAQLYFNVLGRPGEQEGVEFWEDQLAQGVSMAAVLMGFSEGNENIAGVAPEIAGGIWYTV